MFRLAGVFFLLILASGFSAAQSGEPAVTVGPEYHIGFNCPAAQTLDEEANVLWVLMEGCFTYGYTLQAFNILTGENVTGASDYSDKLAILQDVVIEDNANALRVNDGIVTIRYADTDEYMPHTLTFALHDAAVTPDISDADLAELLLTYTEYPETAIYSPDQSLVALTSTDTLTVVEIPSGAIVLQLPVDAESYNAYPSFSADSRLAYVGYFNNFEDFEDWSSTLAVYDLSTGEKIAEQAVPAPFAAVSPDGRYAAIERQSNDGTTSNMLVVDLETGAVSEGVSLYEPRRRATECTNDGRSLSGLDITVDGRFQLGGISWLTDGSGFFYTRSYRGVGLGGGRPCVLDYSRMNSILINGG